METFLRDKVGTLKGLSLYWSKLTCEMCILVVQETYALQNIKLRIVTVLLFDVACKDHVPFLVIYNDCKLTPRRICG